MAKASTSSKPLHSRKPYANAASANSSNNGQISISKLKSNLRQATRLLAKDKLDAQLRVETERRVESLKRELAEAEALRPKSESVKAANVPADGAVPSEQPSSDKVASKGKGKGKKDDKPDRYKMLRHFEYQKTGRRCRKCRKEIQAIEEQLQATGTGVDDDVKAKKKQKKLRKELDRLKLELEMARIDAWYIETFPKNLKYVSLYPPDGYVAFELSSLASGSPETEDQAVSKMPSSKKVDEVRSYWRAVVKGRLERAELRGEPVKQKVEKQKKKQPGAADAIEEMPEAEGTVAAGQDEEASSEDEDNQSAVEVDLDEDENEKDDFFA